MTSDERLSKLRRYGRKFLRASALLAAAPTIKNL